MFYKEMHPRGNLNEVCVFSTMDGGMQHVTERRKQREGYRERKKTSREIKG